MTISDRNERPALCKAASVGIYADELLVGLKQRVHEGTDLFDQLPCRPLDADDRLALLLPLVDDVLMNEGQVAAPKQRPCDLVDDESHVAAEAARRRRQLVVLLDGPPFRSDLELNGGRRLHHLDPPSAHEPDERFDDHSLGNAASLSKGVHRGRSTIKLRQQQLLQDSPRPALVEMKFATPLQDGNCDPDQAHLPPTRRSEGMITALPRCRCVSRASRKRPRNAAS